MAEGASGGPLLNKEGNVIGMMTCNFSDYEKKGNFEDFFDKLYCDYKYEEDQSIYED